jgi:nitrite reductase/ring-hydroxylating ferredoxin subunit
MTHWRNAAAAADVTEGEVLGCLVDGVPVALFRLGDGVFALHDVCSHGQARLSEGFVESGCIECPLHQGLVDIRSGEPRSAPITDPVRSYPTRLVGDRVEISL